MSMDLNELGTKVVDSQKLTSLRNTLSQLVLLESSNRQQEQNGQSDVTSFLGAYPVCLSKRDFAFMRRTKYWVTEKSDGQRCMLLALSEGVYLIDTTFDFYFVETNQFLLPCRSDPAQAQHKTVLDGEMVYNHRFQKYCYMVFDIVCVNGNRIAETNLERRLAAIRDEIMVPLRQIFAEDDERLPFLILGKEFFPIEKLDWLLQQIHHYTDEEGERFVYQHGKRYNENDGIIFIPDKYEYKPGMSTVIKKWKWPQLNTICFQVKVNQERKNRSGNGRRLFKLYLWANNQHIDYRQAYFQPKCQQKLLHDLENPTNNNSALTAIVECSYSPTTGEWRYIRLRTDLAHAHTFTHALQVLEIVADNVDAECLKRNLLQRTSTGAPVTHVSNGTKGQTPPVRTPDVPVQTPVNVGSAETSPGWGDVILDSPLELPVHSPPLNTEVFRPNAENGTIAEPEMYKKRNRTNFEGEAEVQDETALKKLKT